MSIIGISVFALVIIISFNRTWQDKSVVKEKLTEVLQNPEYLEAVILMNADFSVCYNNFQYLLVSVPQNNPYLYGSSLIKIFVSWIPRSIWKGKPEDIVSLIVQKDNPNKFAGGTSQGTTFLGELYWNFSLIGIIIGMYIFGIINKYVKNGIQYHINNPWRIIIFSLLVATFFEFFRGGISTIIVTNTIQYAFPIILFWLSYHLLTGKTILLPKSTFSN